MAFTIDKGIEVYDRHKAPGRKEKYPFTEMEVGDSFHVTGADAKRVISAIGTRTRRGHSERFTTRACGEGRRVWRVK